MTQNTLYSVPFLVENLLEIAQNADTKNYGVALTALHELYLQECSILNV